MMQFLRYSVLLCLAQLAAAVSGHSSGLAAHHPYGEGRPAGVAITGNVLNDKGEPLPSVVVAVKGTPTSTTTNAAGNFLVAVDVDDPVLVFTCAGYQAQALAVQARNGLAVTLYPIGVAPPSSVQPATGAGINGVAYADELPTFPGGEAAYGAYMRQNVHYPEEARKQGMPGIVFINFVVDETGRILDAQVLKGCGNGFDEEALRLVRLMPWWNPGRSLGQIVRSACTLRIKFGVAPAPGN